MTNHRTVLRLLSTKPLKDLIVCARAKIEKRKQQEALRAQRLKVWACDPQDENVFLAASSRDPRYKVEERKARVESLLEDISPLLPEMPRMDVRKY